MILYQHTTILFSIPLLKHLCDISLTIFKYTANKKLALNGYIIMRICIFYSSVIVAKAAIQSLEKAAVIVEATDIIDQQKETINDAPYKKEITKYSLNLQLPMEAELINLPMVYPPRDWTHNKTTQRYIGGYLQTHIISVMRGNAFGNTLDEWLQIIPNDNTSQCLNYLQKIPYRVNNNILDYINNNYQKFIDKDLLIDIKYLNINPTAVGDKECLSMLDGVNVRDDAVISITNHKDIILKYISYKSKASREYYILKIAELFKDYTIYFTAFLDFRGLHTIVRGFTSYSI
nr:putative DNA-directed RNA polymerase [Oedogonium sp. 269]